MDWSRKRELIVRWSLVTTAATALFWFVWWLVAGEVPAVTSVLIPAWGAVELPFAVSRWWDILIGPIWSSLFILLFTDKTIEDEVARSGLVSGLAYGLVYGLVYGLAYGLVYGLAYGLSAGLGVGLACGLVIGLAYGLGVGIRKLFSLELWRTVGRWLIAKKE